MDQKQFEDIVEKQNPKTPMFTNMLKAFLVGGIICTIGQLIIFFYIRFFSFTERTAANPTAATLVFIAMLLTGFGYYKKISQFAGAGSAVPITGFGNSVVSAAIEHKTEGYVLGVGGNMFKLAGSVIVFGVLSAFFVALIKTILVKIGVVSW
ncbi:stage V sporulation protein AC [Psychrobacillus insolitus]|uniref:Stage V sporulation protein AC n=1 Tax=Psychrobacillus insolitus TaxID=1461 RepID=A0A2W7MWK2_9BACI|nr:stage V sporulation protein AC [Psychrobacillus insolitus]PZX08171.1 stage V sporulation protein AC [Psychrobacillus insolitus]